MQLSFIHLAMDAEVLLVLSVCHSDHVSTFSSLNLLLHQKYCPKSWLSSAKCKQKCGQCFPIKLITINENSGSNKEITYMCVIENILFSKITSNKLSTQQIFNLNCTVACQLNKYKYILLDILCVASLNIFISPAAKAGQSKLSANVLWYYRTHLCIEHKQVFIKKCYLIFSFLFIDSWIWFIFKVNIPWGCLSWSTHRLFLLCRGRERNHSREWRELHLRKTMQ